MLPVASGKHYSTNAVAFCRFFRHLTFRRACSPTDSLIAPNRLSRTVRASNFDLKLSEHGDSSAFNRNDKVPRRYVA